MQGSVEYLTEPDRECYPRQGRYALHGCAGDVARAVVEKKCELSAPARAEVAVMPTAWDQLVEFPPRNPGNYVGRARPERQVEVTGRPGCFVWLQERDQAGHQMALSSRRIELVVVLAVFAVVLGDPPGHDVQVGQDGLQIVEQRGAVQADAPLRGRGGGDVGVESQTLEERQHHVPRRPEHSIGNALLGCA